MRIVATLIALPVLLPACDQRAASKPGADGAPARPNVIFILVDTLRADRLGCYGHPGGLSPTMDALARDGVLYERVIASSPWTLPSVASYFCGYYPTVHKVTSYQEALQSAQGSAGQVRYFGDQFTTLAELLQANGYATAGFSANPFVTPQYGFDQGFAHFDASFAANATRGEVVNDAALAWLGQRDRSRPFFLYLHYMDVHDPYTADDVHVDPLVAVVEESPNKRRLSKAEAERHRRFFGKSAVAYRDSPRHRRLFQYADYWQARYDAGVPQVDQFLAELRAKLQEMKLWDDAFVILAADHGESLGEHRIWAHGLSAHQDQLHVPLILRWPGQLPVGVRIPQTVRLFDVMPTLLDQLGIQPPGNLQARSLLGLVRGDVHESLPALAEAVKKKPGEKALVLDQWKLLAHTDDDRYELFNLDDDPTEQRDLAAQFPGRVAELRALLERQMAENAALGENVEIQHADVTPEELRRFKAIGYFGDDEESDADEAGESGDSEREDPPSP